MRLSLYLFCNTIRFIRHGFISNAMELYQILLHLRSLYLPLSLLFYVFDLRSIRFSVLFFHKLLFITMWRAPCNFLPCFKNTCFVPYIIEIRACAKIIMICQTYTIINKSRSGLCKRAVVLQHSLKIK